LVNVALRIDHSRLTLRTDQVRSMRQTSEIELLEVHRIEFNRQRARSAKELSADSADYTDNNDNNKVKTVELLL
jgi:hypothetical protein